MQTNMIKARKMTGIAKFEKECSCDIGCHNRMTKRYKIGGTRENGTWEMLKTETLRVFNVLENK